MIELPIPERVNREANPTFVELLKGAKAHLWTGTPSTLCSHTAYICYAISYFAMRNKIPNVTAQELQRDIAISLDAEAASEEDYSPSYYTWLFDRCAKSGGIQISVRQLFDDDSIQAGRLRWMNQLIEEYGGTP